MRTELAVCEMGYSFVFRLLLFCPILCSDIYPPVYGAAECLVVAFTLNLHTKKSSFLPSFISKPSVRPDSLS